jgi:hypothetical protein
MSRLHRLLDSPSICLVRGRLDLTIIGCAVINVGTDKGLVNLNNSVWTHEVTHDNKYQIQCREANNITDMRTFHKRGKSHMYNIIIQYLMLEMNDESSPRDRQEKHERSLASF